MSCNWGPQGGRMSYWGPVLLVCNNCNSLFCSIMGSGSFYYMSYMGPRGLCNCTCCPTLKPGLSVCHYCTVQEFDLEPSITFTCTGTSALVVKIEQVHSTSTSTSLGQSYGPMCVDNSRILLPGITIICNNNIMYAISTYNTYKGGISGPLGDT